MHTTGYLGATIKAAKDSGEFEAVLSVPTVDRDGEIIDAYAFAPLPAKITIDIDHGMSVATTVGSGVPYYADDGTLMFRGTFASTETAQNARTLVVEGHVDRMSVAYRNAKYQQGDDGIPHLRSGELLNAAIVPIPSNREAMILMSKSAKSDEEVQSLHDMACNLGAACKSEDTNPEPFAVEAAAPAAADTAIAPAAVDTGKAHIALVMSEQFLNS